MAAGGTFGDACGAVMLAGSGGAAGVAGVAAIGEVTCGGGVEDAGLDAAAAAGCTGSVLFTIGISAVGRSLPPARGPDGADGAGLIGLDGGTAATGVRSALVVC